MSIELSKEIMDQIERDTQWLESATPHVGLGPAIYIEGATKYAELWQAAEAKADKYEKALKDVRKWELATGAKIKVKHLDILKDIMQTVNKALTPKTGTDERGL